MRYEAHVAFFLKAISHIRRVRRVAEVQAAFGFGQSRPPARPLLLPRQDGASAMRAADAGITAVVQFVIGNVALADVVPDLAVRPIGQGINLYQAEFCIPLQFARGRAGSGLAATDAG